MPIHRQLLVIIAVLIGINLHISTAAADIFSGLETDTSLDSVVLGDSDTIGDAEEEIEAEYSIKDPADAVELKRLFLDAETITKGYTVTSPEEDFLAGVVDRAVTVPVTVVLKKIPAWHIPHPKTETKVSAMFDVDIRACKGDVDDCGFTETSSLGHLEKPIYIALKYDSGSISEKVIHYWDRPSQEWIPLETTYDYDNSLARAELYLPYARLAVFEDDDNQMGLASWYAFRDCHCAASNVYKRGTQLKVTNISGSARDGRSLIVTVNDYGPDPNIHPDRPIDLDKVAYQYLATSLGSGLMLVKVEVVNPHLAVKY